MQCAQERPEGPVGLTQVVVRDSGEQVVHDVCTYVVMKVLQKAVGAIDALKVTFDIVPVLCVVPFGTGFCVVEEGDDEKPEAVNEVRDPIVLDHVHNPVSEPEPC